MRVFKLGRYSEGHTILHETFVASVPALLIMCFFMLVVTLLFGALIFYCEEGVFKVTEEFPEGAYFRPANNGGEEVSPFKVGIEIDAGTGVWKGVGWRGVVMVGAYMR